MAGMENKLIVDAGDDENETSDGGGVTTQDGHCGPFVTPPQGGNDDGVDF